MDVAGLEVAGLSALHPHVAAFGLVHLHLGPFFTELVMRFGYAAVFTLIFLECTGVPLPGEITLVSAAVFAGTTHRLDIAAVIAAAAAAAVLGGLFGYWVGRRFGFDALHRYGRYIHLTEPRLKIGQWLFMKYGGPIVFLGRFTALLRAYAALLAGANRFPPAPFFWWNLAGGVVWALVFGIGAYVFGHAVQKVAGPVSLVLLIATAAGFVVAHFVFKRYEDRIIARIERELAEGMPPEA
jgi:membrane protein DedA with SNARE-associated domain